MPKISFRPSCAKDLDGLRRSARKPDQRACEILLELQRDLEPSARRRAESRIPKCYKYELPDDYRIVLQETESGAAMVALVAGKHDYVDAFLDGHRGYVFDGKTGHLRELRVGTATETAVEMVPSADLQSEQPVTPEPLRPLFGDFTDEMLGRLGVPSASMLALRALTDPNDFDCMSALHSLAESSPKAADMLLAFATGNAATRQSVLDLAAGKAELTESIPEKAVERFAAASEEFITFDDPTALEEVLERGTLEQWQLTEAFPWDTAPRYLLRDRDKSYGPALRHRLRAMGITEVIFARRSPWQNPQAERLIGSIRRECLDHVIIFSERHLRRVLSSYFQYHHETRTHLSLGKDCPRPRLIQSPSDGNIIAFPEVDGLHHRYERRAA
jgi:hypothetical protein